MTRRAFVVTALALVLGSALAVVGMLWQGGVIGPRAEPDTVAFVPGPVGTVALPELVVVPPTPGGCPGEQFSSPGLPMAAPAETAGGTRTDATVSLGGGSALLVVCLGPVSEIGDAATRTQGLVDDPPIDGTTTGPTAVQNPLGATMAYSNSWGEGRRLTEWHVDHDGWAFAVGALQGQGTVDVAGVAQQVIATWVWTPAA